MHHSKLFGLCLFKINESESAQWRLGAAAKGDPRKLVGGFKFWGRNGVKMASPFPFFKFSR